jgi:aspartyl/glutamyl-tRNA(Asn/Gln) amidotransferase C subunit
MALDDATLDHLADLALLELDDADRPALREDLSVLLAYLGQLQAVDVGDLAPMTRPFDDAADEARAGALPGCREDALDGEAGRTNRRALTQAQLEALAPGWLSGRFRVARTVDDSG